MSAQRREQNGFCFSCAGLPQIGQGRGCCVIHPRWEAAPGSARGGTSESEEALPERPPGLGLGLGRRNIPWSRIENRQRRQWSAVRGPAGGELVEDVPDDGLRLELVVALRAGRHVVGEI